MQLYTSGSTGKPKGVLHTTAGYMVGATTTFKYAFDVKPDDVYWCTADCGWITGHSYVTYGERWQPLVGIAANCTSPGTYRRQNVTHVSLHAYTVGCLHAYTVGCQCCDGC